MHAKPLTLAIVAMFAVALVGCGDSKGGRKTRSSTGGTSGETSSTSGEKPAEKDKSPTEVAGASTSSTPAGEGWGNLKGKFIYNGEPPKPSKLDVSKEPFCMKHDVVDEWLVVGPDKGVANIAVWVKTPGVKIHPDYDAKKKEKVVINNENCRFEPHIMAYWVGQPLTVKNSDPVGHNTNAALDANPAFNESIGANSEKDRPPLESAEARAISVTCGMHTWMKGWLFVQGHPYTAVSGKDGAFELKNLPAGTELEFVVWQESAGYVKGEIDGKDAGWAHDRTKNKRYSFKYTIKPGDNDLGTIKLDPNQFKKLGS